VASRLRQRDLSSNLLYGYTSYGANVKRKGVTPLFNL
jgi:hypothetical protein